MKLSIIIPCFNAESTIDYCLESLIDNKLFGNYEIICVNDGSTDGTLGKLNEWKKRFPQTINVIDSPHDNLSTARNLGIDNALGEWLFFCDADDYITKGAFSPIMRSIESRVFESVYN